jgi:hypothetical protein
MAHPVADPGPDSVPLRPGVPFCAPKNVFLKIKAKLCPSLLNFLQKPIPNKATLNPKKAKFPARKPKSTHPKPKAIGPGWLPLEPGRLTS